MGSGAAFGGLGATGGLGRLGTSATPGASEPAPVMVAGIAGRLIGPGTAQTASTYTSNGTAQTFAKTTRNESGAPITVASLVFGAFAIQSANAGTPIGLPGNALTYSAMQLEYPVGTVIGTFQQSAGGSFALASGDMVATDALTLGAAIPVDGIYLVRFTVQVANGEKLVHDGGYYGLRTHALSNAIRKRFAAFGDSLTQDGIWADGTLGAAVGKCPFIQIAIAGTRGDFYIGAANDRLSSLCDLLGVTNVVWSYLANDFNANVSEGAAAATLTSARAAFATNGKTFHPTTPTPRSTSSPAVAVVSAVVDGAAEPVLTVTIGAADAPRFEAEGPYWISGFATGTELNGLWWFTRVDDTTLTAPAPVAHAGIAAGGGTPIIRPAGGSNYSGSSSYTQAGGTASFVSPTPQTSPRALIRDRIRAGEWGSAILDWAAGLELGNTGKFRTRQDQPNPYNVDHVRRTVSSAFLAANQFSFTPSAANGLSSGAYVLFLTGTNRGRNRLVNGQTTSVVTAQSAFPNVPAAGDEIVLLSASANPTLDGTHMIGTGAGGNALQNQRDINRAFLDGLLGA